MGWMGEAGEGDWQMPATAPGGILDAPPGANTGTSLSLLMDDQQLADAGIAPSGGDSTDVGSASQAGSRRPIGEIPGYPEAGSGAWRAGLDDQINTGVDGYNSKHGLNPDDPLYLTPHLVKSWIMEESGGDRSAFQSDPMQVNKQADWKKTGVDKHRILGLTEGQAMTPQTSIPAGLDWFYDRGAIHDSGHKVTGFRNLPNALSRYNARANVDRNGLPHYQNYATDILGR
jgi:hypothetical protein